MDDTREATPRPAMEARERLALLIPGRTLEGVLPVADSILKALNLSDDAALALMDGRPAKRFFMSKDAALALMDGRPAKRFFMSKDNDSHWYLVPVARRADWDTWRDIPEDDERAWDPPDFAKRLNDAPSLVTFENPEIDR